MSFEDPMSCKKLKRKKEKRSKDSTIPAIPLSSKHIYIYIYIYIYHHHHVTLSARIFLTLFRQVLKATSHIGTDLLYVGSSWTSCLCSSMWKGPQEYITYVLVPTSSAVSCMSGSSNFDSFRYEYLVSVELNTKKEETEMSPCCNG